MAYDLTISEKIRDIIKGVLGDSTPFKQVFIGDPLLIPAHFLPCLCIDKISTRYPNEVPTGTEERVHEVKVIAVFNKKDEFGKSQDEVTLQRTMENIVEGIDLATGRLDTKSLLGILRQNFTLGGVVISNEVLVEYFIGNQRKDVTTAEAELNFTLGERLVLDNRT